MEHHANKTGLFHTSSMPSAPEDLSWITLGSFYYFNIAHSDTVNLQSVLEVTSVIYDTLKLTDLH